VTEIPRRCYINKMSPAELAIHDAKRVVEEAGCDVLLTEAIILLSEAQEKVADYFDLMSVQPKPKPVPPVNASSLAGGDPTDLRFGLDETI